MVTLVTHNVASALTITGKLHDVVSHTMHKCTPHGCLGPLPGRIHASVLKTELHSRTVRVLSTRCCGSPTMTAAVQAAHRQHTCSPLHGTTHTMLSFTKLHYICCTVHTAYMLLLQVPYAHTYRPAMYISLCCCLPLCMASVLLRAPHQAPTRMDCMT
jgi:hypothetical protein